MTNLLEETNAVLTDAGFKTEDVLWCGSEEFGWFTWSDFEVVADADYDSGYGSAEVATDLRVVGTHFWLERHEYDGSEWWEVKQVPVRPVEYRVPRKVIGRLWDDLSELNKDDE